MIERRWPEFRWPKDMYPDVKYPEYHYGARSPWTPAEDMPTAWYRATEGITKDANNYVSQWDDLSGNGYHYVQGVGANQPVFGKSLHFLDCLQFDGVNSFMSITAGYQASSNNSIIFTVVDITNATPVNRIINNEAGGGTRHGLFTYSTGCNYIHSNGFNPIKTTDPITAGNFILSGHRNGTTQEANINADGDTNTSGATCPTLDSWTLGSTSGGGGRFNGNIMEIIVYTKYNADLMNKLDGYLHYKYNKALPSGHPYENAKPLEGA